MPSIALREGGAVKAYLPSHSEIAAGGIALVRHSFMRRRTSFHTFGIFRINYFTLSVVEGSSLWLSHPAKRGSSSLSFENEAPVPIINWYQGLRLVPCLLLSGLSFPTLRRGGYPASADRVNYIIKGYFIQIYNMLSWSV